MKKMLMRPTAALFPAVLLLATLVGGEYPAGYLFLYWMALQLLSLCSVDAFRNAAAREPGVRRVDRRFSGAWITILLGVGLLMALLHFVFAVNPLQGDSLGLLIAAAGITIEQLFEERMFALSRRTDGVVLGVLANVLLLAGLMMDASGGVVAPVEMECFFTACGAGMGMLISVMANYAMEPMRKFSLVPRNIGFFPKAAVQGLLYPAAGWGMIAANLLSDGAIFGHQMGFSFVFCGWVLWRLARTVCRRANDESRPLNLLLMFVCAALASAVLWVPGLERYANTAAVAMICALIVYCAPGWRVYLGAVLVIAANGLVVYPLLQGSMQMAAVIAACAIAVVLNLHKAFLRKV